MPADGAAGTQDLPASRCARCGHLACPPTAYCPAGCASAMSAARVAPEGVLYASTVVHVTHPVLSAPYQVGYVDLADGPRLFGQLPSEDLVPLGTPVRVRFEEPSGADGSEGTRVLFEPRPGDGRQP